VQLLTDVLHICGVVEVFEDYSVCPLFLQLVCVIIYSILFEVLDEVAVCVWHRAVKFDDVVCQTFGVVLFILGYFTYAFHHFPLVNNAVNKDGRRFMVLWWPKLFP